MEIFITNYLKRVFMELLLTSSFPMKGNSAIIETIQKNHDLSNLKTAYIFFTKIHKKYLQMVDDYGFKQVTGLLLSPSLNISALKEYELLLFHGGNPFMIKSIIKQAQIQDYLINKTDGMMITTSGSSMVCSSSLRFFQVFYPKHTKKYPKDKESLAIFPKEIIPHFNRYRNLLNPLNCISINSFRL